MELLLKKLYIYIRWNLFVEAVINVFALDFMSSLKDVFRLRTESFISSWKMAYVKGFLFTKGNLMSLCSIFCWDICCDWSAWVLVVGSLWWLAISTCVISAQDWNSRAFLVLGYYCWLYNFWSMWNQVNVSCSNNSFVKRNGQLCY